MTIKRATVDHSGLGARFLARTDSGHTSAFDNAEGNSAARPMEVVLSALGACTAMDVLSILHKKRQPVEHYRVRVEGEQRADHPRVFTSIRIVHEVDGRDVDREALRRAIELSAGKYCSVGAMLSAGMARISHWYVLRGEVPFDDDVREVIVIGPHRDVGPETVASLPSGPIGSAT